MNVKEHAELLRHRFILRETAFVKQWKSAFGSGYTKQVDDEGNDVALSEQDVIDHIKGKHTLGIYQLDDDKVKTICFDVDTKDNEKARAQTLVLAKFLADTFGKGRFLVEDSGNKGYHVWLFFEPVVSAAFAYRVGRWIHSEVEQIQGVGIEVFPKQETTHGAYGNLVKLPWGTHLKSKQKCVFVNGKFEKFENQYEALNTVQPLRVTNYATFCKHFNVPEIERPQYESGDRMMCMADIMTNGADEGHRDIAFHKLAAHLRQNGLPQDITGMVLDVVNERSNPPAPEKDVRGKIEGVYKNGYYASACREPGLDRYCNPECALFTRKAEIRGMTIEQLTGIVGR